MFGLTNRTEMYNSMSCKTKKSVTLGKLEPVLLGSTTFTLADTFCPKQHTILHKYIHTHTYARCQPAHQEQFWVQLTKAHFDMQTRGIYPWATAARPQVKHIAQLNHIHSIQACRSPSMSGLPWRGLEEETAANVSCSKTFFLVNSLYTNNVLNARVHVKRPWWYYE